MSQLTNNFKRFIDCEISNNIIKQFSLPAKRTKTIHDESQYQNNPNELRGTNLDFVNDEAHAGSSWSNTKGINESHEIETELPNTNAILTEEESFDPPSIEMDHYIGKEIRVQGIICGIKFTPKRRGTNRSCNHDLPTLNRYNRKWYQSGLKFPGCPAPLGTSKENLITRVLAIEYRSGLLNFCVEFEINNDTKRVVDYVDPADKIRWIPYNAMILIEHKQPLRDFVRDHTMPSNMIFTLLSHGFSLEGTITLKVRSDEMTLDIR